MNFKSALCPSCGGKMQMPDDVSMVKCMYCGVDVIVKEAIRLALTGRVKEFTQATAIEKVIERKPYDIENDKKQTLIMIAIFGGMGLMLALFVGSSEKAFGIILGITFFVFLPIILIIRYKSHQKALEADEKMKDKPPTVIVTGYSGQCPYCSSSITLKANVPGDNCRACEKRIVIRDSKFYSVDTPIGGLEKTI